MTNVTVRIPSPLRALAGGHGVVSAAGASVGEVLREVGRAHPGLGHQLFTDEGRLRSFISVYLNDEDVRSLARDATPVKDGDVVAIVPALAGGSGPTRSPLDDRAGSMGPLSAPELHRYSRHLLLPEVWVKGQKRLKAAKVLLVGAGGLGAPAALYLTAAGVGEIGLVDFDRVEVSNLQRQVLYGVGDVGRPKLEAARRRLLDLNPEVRVTLHEAPLTSANAFDVLRPYDLVVDGTDNFPTRYLVNDACVLLGKPNVYGSIYRFEGQASVFDAKRGPCYRCLYAEPPPPGLVPSCAEGGVLGVLPGIVGLIQAVETVKLLLGTGEPLVGRLLLFDALEMRFRELKLHKNPECVLCGDHPTQTGLIDYPAFCGVLADPSDASHGLPSVGAEEVKARIDADDAPFLLDVRDPNEWDIAHLPDAHLIPLAELPERVTEVAQAKDVVVYCLTGGRSAQATRLLLSLGFTHVRNLEGGIRAWAEKVDLTMPRY